MFVGVFFFLNSLNKYLTSKDLQNCYMKLFHQQCSNLPGSESGEEVNQAKMKILAVSLCISVEAADSSTTCDHYVTTQQLVLLCLGSPFPKSTPTTWQCGGLPWTPLGLEALLSTNGYFFSRRQRE